MNKAIIIFTAILLSTSVVFAGNKAKVENVIGKAQYRELSGGQESDIQQYYQPDGF